MKKIKTVKQAFIWLTVGAFTGLVVAGQTCLAQTAVEGEVSKETRTAPETSVPPPAPQASKSISKLTNRISTRERLAPDREDSVAFSLGNKHINAITGGLAQGAGLPMGLEFTTADSIKWIEFRLSALTSTKLYRRFEASAYIPVIGDENTHAEIWVSYLRRTEDKFFGIGPRFPKDFQTNFDLEQRAINATIYHNFERSGSKFSLWFDESSFEGDSRFPQESLILSVTTP